MPSAVLLNLNSIDKILHLRFWKNLFCFFCCFINELKWIVALKVIMDVIYLRPTLIYRYGYRTFSEMLWRTCGCGSNQHFAEAHPFSQQKHTGSGSFKACTLNSQKPCPLSTFDWSANWLSWICRSYFMGVPKV